MPISPKLTNVWLQSANKTLQQLDDVETKLAALFKEIGNHASLFSEV
jgi:hypothetical protein